MLNRTDFGWRSETPMPANMTGRAHHALMCQILRHISGQLLLRNLRPAQFKRDECLLLSQRGMTAQALVALSLIHQL